MLSHVDRVVLAVQDRTAAAETFAALFGAGVLREDRVEHLAAHRTVLQAGVSEFELLQPDGAGPVADFLSSRGEGLFAAGLASPALDLVADRLRTARVPYTPEQGQLWIEPAHLYGMRTVLSEAVNRSVLGDGFGHLYEVTNVVADATAAAQRYAQLFGLNYDSFCQINSSEWGYSGSLTMFDTPARLDRIEVIQTTDPSKAMGRFYAKQGESLYMCYGEVDDVDALADRLESRSGRYQARGERGRMDGLWIHPSALHGMLMGISRTSYAWSWSCRPDLVLPHPAGLVSSQEHPPA